MSTVGIVRMWYKQPSPLWWTELYRIQLVEWIPDEGIERQDFHAVLPAVLEITSRWRATHTTRNGGLWAFLAPKFPTKICSGQVKENPVSQAKLLEWCVSSLYTRILVSQWPTSLPLLPIILITAGRYWSTWWFSGWGHLLPEGSFHKKLEEMLSAQRREPLPLEGHMVMPVLSI